ncbi:MAG: class I fructose-bisphosphate aldolase [Thermomicrobiales bacterium]
MSRMFAADGKTVTLAFDHGNWGANTGGMANPAQTLQDAVAAGADAVLTTIGQALEFGRFIKTIGIAINMDDFVGDPTPLVDQALAMGVDMGKVIAYTGPEGDAVTIRKAHLLSAICRQRSFPLMIEPIPGGFDKPEQHTAENIGIAGRTAAEIGADLVKLQYCGPQETYASVLRPIFRPTIMLGGANRGDIRAVLQDVYDGMQAGAVGIAIGRNIWAHETPAKVVAAMGTIIHGSGSVDEAMKELT